MNYVAWTSLKRACEAYFMDIQSFNEAYAMYFMDVQSFKRMCAMSFVTVHNKNCSESMLFDPLQSCATMKRISFVAKTSIYWLATPLLASRVVHTSIVY